MWRLGLRKIINTIFYGNYFYGLCAVALAIEAAVQQHYPMPDVLCLVLIFILPLLYYTQIYLDAHSRFENPRLEWYCQNRKPIIIRHSLSAIVFLLISLYVILINQNNFNKQSFANYLIVSVFPLAAIAYNGSKWGFNLRRVVWLKPFVIGFVWAGVVTIYPIFYYNFTQGIDAPFTLLEGLLWFKNFMFIAIIGIIFDIKDYAEDYQEHFETIVTLLGLRRTLTFLIMPLTLLGLCSFVLYAFQHQFSMPKILLNVIPFILLLQSAYALSRPRSILYYLIVIDGMLLVKAVCGIVGMLWF